MDAVNCREPNEQRPRGPFFSMDDSGFPVIHDGIKPTKEESDRAAQWLKKTSLEEESGEYKSAFVAVLLYLVRVLFI